MSRETKIAIVVLNWNGASDSIACIDSLLSSTIIPDIILVDNNSSDNSVEILDQYIKQFQNIHFIKNNKNSGFTGGNNVGFIHALSKNYDYIGTLNPDAVASKEWVENLVSELNLSNEVGIATGILARQDYKTIDTTGEIYSIWGVPSPRGRDTLLKNAPSKPEFIFASTGGGFITRASVLRSIGMFDEKFFMYFEDVDLCFRAQLAGYKVRYTPKAIAYHKLSASTNKVPGLAVYNTFKNLPMLFLRNVPLRLWGTILPRFTLAYVLILGNAIVHKRGIPALKGWLMSIYHLPHSLISRRVIQKSRRVSAGYISSIMLHDIPPEQTGLRKFRSLFISDHK